MAIEKCINEFDVNDVIFEEGSTGRELFVVLDGKVEIAKVNGASKTVIVTLGKGEFFGEMAVIDGSSRSATAIAAAPHTRVMRINHARFVYLVSQQPAFALMIMDALSASGCGPPTPSLSEPRPIHERPQAEPVQDPARQRGLHADPGGRGRLPDPLQEPRGQCLSGARQQADHHDRRRAVLQLSASPGLPRPCRLSRPRRSTWWC